MLPVLIVHGAAALIAPLLVRALGRPAFAVLAAVPAGAAVWILLSGTNLGSGESRQSATPWIPAINLELAFRLDALATVLAGIVTVGGAVVLLYCARYFEPDSPGSARFAAQFTGFAAAMLGLVLADNVLLLYVFWELTTLFSYLLIGHESHQTESRRAALQALIVTTFGGLAMLVGLVALAEHSGTYRLSELAARDDLTRDLTGDDPVVVAAVTLILLGALTKSAIVPFHFWLPAAMAAPTPVSAYLHAAAMVKAGVYLVARLAPALAEVPPWPALTVGLGLVTMLVAGWRALREPDLKRLLAYGTISQLGFLLVLFGAGTQKAALAGLVLLIGHAMFKAALFLAVGVIDHTTGTRDARQLSGLGRAAPLFAITTGLAVASMAGLPPLFGFVGKEAAFAAFADVGSARDLAVLTGLVAGSLLTVAYSAAFWWGAFATKPGVDPQPTSVGLDPLLRAAPAALAVAGLVAGCAARVLDLPRYPETLPGPAPSHLALWHGVTIELALSVLAVAGGAALFAARARMTALGADRLPGAEHMYRRVTDLLDRLAAAVGAFAQRGALPTYLGVILATLIALPGGALVWALLADAENRPDSWRIWDRPEQAAVALAVVVLSAAVLRARDALSAAVLAGASGYALAVLFAVHGAPDLALTQFLVESVTLAVVVLVVRKLPAEFAVREGRVRRGTRAAIALGAGVALAGLGAAAAGARTGAPAGDRIPQAAVTEGGGTNVVNVVLVDIRAWDTLGEISVLVVAATGVASMVFLRGRAGRPPRPPRPTGAGDAAARRERRQPWLRGGRHVHADRRLLLLEVLTRFLFHPMIVLSLFLLFSGHNSPGGGFAGGLVAGLALTVRYLAGGRYEFGEAAPVEAGAVIGVGLLTAAGTALAGLLLAGSALSSEILTATLPVFGEVKLVTSLFFDIGVYLIVVGLALDALGALGAELDRREDAAQERTEQERTERAPAR